MTRGHSFKLFKKRVSMDVGRRRYMFGNRVCNEWILLTGCGVGRIAEHF